MKLGKMLINSVSVLFMTTSMYNLGSYLNETNVQASSKKYVAKVNLKNSYLYNFSNLKHKKFKIQNNKQWKVIRATKKATYVKLGKKKGWVFSNRVLKLNKHNVKLERYEKFAKNHLKYRIKKQHRYVVKGLYLYKTSNLKHRQFKIKTNKKWKVLQVNKKSTRIKLGKQKGWVYTKKLESILVKQHYLFRKQQSKLNKKKVVNTINHQSYIATTTADNNKPAEQPVKPADNNKPAITPVKPADNNKPAVEPVKPADNNKPTVQPVKPADNNKPAVTPVKPADNNKPTVTPVKPADNNKPAVEPVKPADNNKPAVTPAKPADNNKPTVQPVKPADNNKPTVQPVKPADNNKPAVTPVKPADNNKPAVTPVKPADNNKPEVTPAKANDPFENQYAVIFNNNLQYDLHNGTVSSMYFEEYKVAKQEDANLPLPSEYINGLKSNANTLPQLDNTFTASKNDFYNEVDLDNMTADQKQELSEFTSSVINSIRHQFGNDDESTTTNKGVQQFADDVAKQYDKDNWSLFAGHDVAGINTVSQKYGLSINDQYTQPYEDAAINNIYIPAKSNMSSIKSVVYYNIINMLDNDRMWDNGHSQNLAGITDKGFGHAYLATSFDKQHQLHILNVPTKLILNHNAQASVEHEN